MRVAIIPSQGVFLPAEQLVHKAKNDPTNYLITAWPSGHKLKYHVQAGWPNGKALDYESRDCRFDPCVGQLFVFVLFFALLFF